MTERQTLGRRIASLRETAELTQQQLADAAGVPVSTLRNWEQDHREPMASVVVRLAKGLGISPGPLLEGVVFPTKGRGPAKKPRKKGQ
jgi:transcriptional regulator with XRE-family HTH domain